MAKKDLGTTILATLVFYFLNVVGGLWLESQGATRAIVSGLWKAAIYAAIFHVLHYTIARLFGWYKPKN